MKPQLLLTATLTLLVSFSGYCQTVDITPPPPVKPTASETANAANSRDAANAAIAASIQILDDVSGPELEKQGIRPADYEALEAIANVFFDARLTASLNYDVVDGNGADNVPLHFMLSHFDQAPRSALSSKA